MSVTLDRLRFRVGLEQMLSSFLDGMCGKEPVPQSAARHAHIAAPPRLPRGGAGPAVPGLTPAAVARWARVSNPLPQTLTASLTLTLV